MILRIDYGREGMEVDIPEGNLLKVLRMSPAAPLAEPGEAVAASLREPMDSPPLAELARGKRTACVAICDVTRPAPNRVLLPPLLRALEEAGVPRDGTTILIATGLHRACTADEIGELVGAEIARDHRVENHVARDEDSHELLGTTEGGVPAYVDRRFLQADLHVVIGFIEPHLMAGFSGGRKLVCPGLAATATIKAFHSPAMVEHGRAREGVLDGNPVHRESLRVARMARVDFAVDVALDAERGIVGVFSGELEASHLAGVEFVRRHVRDTVPEPADIVVTTSAGSPLDATFYQAIKGVTAAMGVVKEGGTILLAAECAEGLGGPEFTQLLKAHPDPLAFGESVFDDDFFVIDQWQYQELVKALRKLAVILVNDDLPEELRRLVPVPVRARFEDALADATARHGGEARIAVIPRGPYVLAEVAR